MRVTVLWVVAVAGTSVFGVRVAGMDGRLKARIGGYGIVALELAFVPQRARAILLAWGDAGRGEARRSLRDDFGFIVFYALLLGLLVSWAAGAIANARWWEWDGLEWLAVGAVIGAAILDVVENGLLLLVLSPRWERALHSGSRRSAAVARLLPGAAGVAAVLKFVVIIAAVLLIVAGVVASLGTAP